MSIELSSVDVHYVVMELQSFVGAKVEKAFQSDTNKRDILLQFYCADTEKRNLRLLLPGIICTPKEKPSYPQLPPGFAMFLRKRLGGTRITAIEQVGFDRIIRFTFAAKRDDTLTSMTLILELMAPGNMILIDDKEHIINLLEQQQFKDRQLRSHQAYVAPPAPYNSIAASEEELARHLFASTRTSIVTTLAIHCGLGGTYAEEVCIRAGIPKHRNDLTQDEIMLVARTIKSVLSQPICAAADETRAYPFLLSGKTTSPCEETRFLDALCAFVSDDMVSATSKSEKRQRERSTPKAKQQAVIDAQQANVDRLSASAMAEQAKAEALYLHYVAVQEMLDMVRKARAEKRDISSVLADTKGFVAYDDATGELTIDLPDAASGARAQEDASSDDARGV